MRKELAWLRRGAPARTSKPKFRIDAANQLIEDVPPVRNPIELQRMAVARLGKDVIDLEDAGVSFGDRTILRNITWRIAPGERTGILGANGAGKSTLLGLVAGTIAPTSGRVKRGKTVKFGFLDQQFSQLASIGSDRVREVLARTKTTFTIEGRDHTPAQLLERLGFAREHLSARVDDLSGGQKRRLQLLLLLLDEPNVIALDEPTNDVDSDMLAAMEDLLDSWPGTLIVISHDRYLLERVTDQQYAILDGRLRHVPGGVDEYLRLRAAQAGTTGARDVVAQATATTTKGADGPPSSSAEASVDPATQREARKAMARIEKQLAKVAAREDRLHHEMAEAVHDHTRLAELNATLGELAEEKEMLELSSGWSAPSSSGEPGRRGARSGLEGGEQALEGAGERGALVGRHVIEELALAGEQVGHRRVDRRLALLRQADDDAPAIGGRRESLDPALGGEAVDAVGHRPRGHERLLDEAAGGELVGLTGATQRGEHVELPALELVPGEGARAVEVEQPGQSGDAGEDVERLDVEVGALASPGLDDGVDVVGRVVAAAHPSRIPAVMNLDVETNRGVAARLLGPEAGGKH